MHVPISDCTCVNDAAILQRHAFNLDRFVTYTTLAVQSWPCCACPCRVPALLRSVPFRFCMFRCEEEEEEEEESSVS